MTALSVLTPPFQPIQTGDTEYVFDYDSTRLSVIRLNVPEIYEIELERGTQTTGNDKHIAYYSLGLVLASTLITVLKTICIVADQGGLVGGGGKTTATYKMENGHSFSVISILSRIHDTYLLDFAIEKSPSPLHILILGILEVLADPPSEKFWAYPFEHKPLQELLTNFQS